MDDDNINDLVRKLEEEGEFAIFKQNEDQIKAFERDFDAKKIRGAGPSSSATLRQHEITLGPASLLVSIDDTTNLPPLSISYPGSMRSWDTVNLMAYVESLRRPNQYLAGPFARLSGSGEQHTYDLRNAWDMELFKASLSGGRSFVETVCLYTNTNIPRLAEQVYQAAIFQIDPDPTELLLIDYAKAIHSPETFVPQMLARHADLRRVTPAYVADVAERIGAIAKEYQPPAQTYQF